MVSFLGDEKNIFQNEVPGEVMEETDEMCIWKQMIILIHSANTDIKKFSQLKMDKNEEHSSCMEKMLLTSFSKFQ